MKQNKFNKPNQKYDAKKYDAKKYDAKKYDDLLSVNQALVYGKHSVFAALLNKNRKIYQILATKNSQAELNTFIIDNKIINYQSLIKIVDNEYINSLMQQDSIHQGLILKCSPIKTISHQQFLDKVGGFLPENLPKILILDGLNDPHNIGAIIRSAVAFGFRNIIIPERNFPLNSPIIAKSSCGMLELVDLIAAPNLNNFLLDLKKIGYWRIGLDGEAKTDISVTKNYQPIALILGSEGDGIRRLVKENCDLLVKINLKLEVESLNVSNAAAIAMYEINR